MLNTESNGGSEHWARVYSEKAVDSVSWYQAEPTLSLTMIVRAAAPPAQVIDVGGGTSFLVDRLLVKGYRPAVLDIAAEPLDVVKARLGSAAEDVDWLVADVTMFNPAKKWDVWHDRAVYHFLTDGQDRDRYRQSVLRATKIGSSVIVATFGPNGPARCSGLPTVRYAPEELRREFPDLELMEAAEENHQTPGGSIQPFIYCRFRRE
ncbi:class I SAM-dependent methyltransferase [soil metagenome]